MFVVPRPRMLVERVQFALWEQSAVGRRMITEAEPEQLSGSVAELYLVSPVPC